MHCLTHHWLAVAGRAGEKARKLMEALFFFNSEIVVLVIISNNYFTIINIKLLVE